MGYREVRVFEGEFPTFEQLMTGDPARPPYPQEVWQKQLQLGEFAVRYKDFKTGLPRSVEGKPVGASETCRIFDNLEEARINSRDITREHWTVVSEVFDSNGAQVEIISNKKEIGKFAAVAYLGILLWLAVPTLVVLGGLWLIYQTVHAALFPSKDLLGSLGWLEWLGFLAGSFALAVLGYYLRIRFIARHVAAKIRASINPEDRARFEDINRLYGTTEPKGREKLLRLQKELQEKVRQSLKS